MTALKKIHVAKRQLGLDEDTYRAVLTRVTGKASAGAMTEGEQELVLAEFQRQGFKPALKAPRKDGKAALSGPYAKKLQALWISAWNLGLVFDRQDSALLAFVERQTGIQRTEFLRAAADGRKAVEGLKAWLAREAGVDWSETGTEAHGRFGYRIACAQWAILFPNGRATFWTEVGRILARSVLTNKPSDKEWQTVMNALGKRIRDTRKKAVA
ncbi:regulatory protein GemA [Aureimonas sp. SK2]|uniref:gp16 family protein n=1 Tax=Aureimonas sp. SK2 TaxID=3015992 RepID=UPI0024451A87|nr:regulatory protein GemA [Aureimonas sp. SK2]